MCRGSISTLGGCGDAVLGALPCSIFTCLAFASVAENLKYDTDHLASQIYLFSALQLDRQMLPILAPSVFLIADPIDVCDRAAAIPFQTGNALMLTLDDGGIRIK